MPQPQLIPPEIPGEAFVGFARRLATNAARFPGAPAVIDENRRLDWGSFAELVARIAGGLTMHGIGRGDMWFEGKSLSNSFLCPSGPIDFDNKNAKILIKNATHDDGNFCNLVFSL